MRRILPFFCLFAGMVMLTAAIAIPTWLVDKLRVVPLDLDITSVAVSKPAGLTAHDDTPALAFDRCSVSEPHAKVAEVHLTQQRRTVVTAPSDATRTTLQSGQTVRIDRMRDGGTVTTPELAAAGQPRACSDALVVSSVDLVGIDRSTSRPDGAENRLFTVEPPLGQSTTGDDERSVSIPRQGYQYKFGFSVPKSTQPYHDLGSRKDWPANFVGETTIRGVRAYEFESVVPEYDQSTLPAANGEVPLGSTLSMPAKWWGIQGPGIDPDKPIEMHRFGTSVRKVFVEPTTGTILDGSELQDVYFRVPDNADVPQQVKDFRLVVGKSLIGWDDNTISEQAERAAHYRQLLIVGGIVLPVVLGVVGAIAVGSGLLWLRRRHNSTPVAEEAGDA